MSQNHELRLTIDASSAKRGSDEFRSAVAAVKRAVSGLDRDTTGAFTTLRKGATINLDARPVTNTSKELIALDRNVKRWEASTKSASLSAAAAMRTSENEAQRLAARLDTLGDTGAIRQLDAELDRLKSTLATINKPIEVRAARSNFADVSSSLKRQAVSLESVASAEREAASSANTHAAELDSLRQKYNPLYAASKTYETALNEIATAERAGVISSQLAADARQRASTALTAANTQLDGYAKTSRMSGLATSNLAAQFNDIGVMMASGQSPFILAIQQGTQVSQVLNQMGGSASAVGASLRSAFLSVINPVSLLTIATIAGGAALGQWAMSAFNAEVEAKSFEDRLDDLAQAVAEYRRLADEASRTTSDLGDRFGPLGSQASAASRALVEIGKLDAIRAADGAVAALTERFGGLSRTELVSTRGGILKEIDQTFFELRNELSLTDTQAAAVMRSLEGLATAETMGGKVAAANALNQAFVRVFGSVEAIPPALLNVQREALLVALRVAEIEGAAQQTNRTAQSMLGDLRAQADLQRLIAEHGRESAEVARFKAKAERDAYEETVGSLDVSEALKTEIMQAYDAAAGLAATNMTSPINSASEAAATLARNLGIALSAAQSLLNLRESKTYSGRGGDPRAYMEGGAQSDYESNLNYKPVSELITELTPKPSKGRSSGGSGSRGRSAALSEEQRALERVNSSIEDRLASLQDEAKALDLVASGQFATVEAARLYAEAQRAGIDVADESTAAMLRQIDALTMLRQASTNPVREAFGRGAEDALADAFSGQFDASKIVNQLRQSIARTLSQDLLSTFAPGLQTGLQGGVVRGSMQGAAMMRTAILSAGQQHAAMVSAAMTGGAVPGGMMQSVAPTSGGLFSRLFGIPAFAEGTPNTSGAMPAILHANEAVIPLSRGRKVPVEMSGSSPGGAGSVSIGDVTVRVEGGSGRESDPEQAQRIGEAVREQLGVMVDQRIAGAMQYGSPYRRRGG